MKNELKVKLTSLIYLLPLFILATYIAKDSSSIAVDIAITVGFLAFIAVAFVGAVHYIKSCDESAKTGVEVLTFFTAVLFVIEVIALIAFAVTKGAGAFADFTALSSWIVLIYLVVLAAPLLIIILRNIASNLKYFKIAKVSSPVFFVFGLAAIIAYVLASNFMEANDVIVEGVAPAISPELFSGFVLAGLLIFVALGVINWAVVFFGYDKE